MIVKAVRPLHSTVGGRRSGVVADGRREADEGVSLLRTTLEEYSENSVLHGVRYVGERDRPRSERVGWFVAVFGSFLGSGWLILLAWQQWVENPVLISFADKPTPVWDIPFPTVTVCPSIKYRKQAFDLSKTWRNGRMNLTAEERKVSDDLMLVCRSMGLFAQQGDYPSFADEETLKNILGVAPRLSETVKCVGVADGTPCPWMMGTILTSDGVCFTYNALPNRSLYRQESPRQQIWSLEGGYRDRAGLLELPKRASGAGLTRGVALQLVSNISDLDYSCHQWQGFKITVTSPADVPNTRDHYHFIPSTGLTQMAVVPHVADTEDALRSYSPSLRHCYFPSERRLAFFAAYTQENCELECSTNYTLRVCNCVDFYMPRESSTPICGFGSAACMDRAQQSLEKEVMEDSLGYRRSENICHCLPSCTSMGYTAEISQSALEINSLAEASKIDPKLISNKTMNVLFIFIKHSEFYALRRRELNGMTSFVGNCGGLLGLCCGFSILSIAEFLYFFTVRMWNNSKRLTGGDEKRRLNPSRRPPLYQAWY